MGMWGPRQSPPAGWWVPQLEQGQQGEGLAERWGGKRWREMDLGVTAEVGRPFVDTEAGLILLRSPRVSACVSGPGSGQGSVCVCGSGADCWSECAYGQAEGPGGHGVEGKVVTGQQQLDCREEELWEGPGPVQKAEALAGADRGARGELQEPAVWGCFAA